MPGSGQAGGGEEQVKHVQDVHHLHGLQPPRGGHGGQLCGSRSDQAKIAVQEHGVSGVEEHRVGAVGGRGQDTDGQDQAVDHSHHRR